MVYIVILLMIIGLVGIVVPMIPGIGLIYLSALTYGFITNFEKIGMKTIIFFTLLTIVSFVLDYIGSYLGAKKFGATKYGIIGGIIGGILGLFVLTIPGLLIGQFVGTCIGELYYGKELEVSMKSGFGTVVGYILGVVCNMTIGLSMVAVFVIGVLW